MPPTAIVRVNRKAAQRVASGHPWIFSSDVVDRGTATAGEAVQVLDTRDRPLGTFHYSAASQISLRRLSTRIENIDAGFFRRRIQAAVGYRRRVVGGSTAFRLVYSEADRLPGLVVDRYADCLVAQMLDQGMDRAKEEIVAVLQELFSPRAIVLRNDAAVRGKEALPLESAVVRGALDGPVAVEINGLKLEADLLKGQKTGVFLDQRENYLAAARYAHGAALDCFTCSGGFALHMAAHCESVEAVDSSAEALAAAERNRALSGIANVSFREANVFDLLAGYVSAGRKFSTVVLDPPAFAKSRTALEGAARGYKEINLRALQLLDRGGVLVTCSCSHHLGEAMFLEIVAQASLDAGRSLRVLERRTQAQDHPILLTVPETCYLKCLILEVI